ncbi:MAG: hypothetical protein N3B10_06865 [Armatimonadetes bacterium]|nr:hypothetical protein [Armatimonadota bacterium]
MRRWFYNEDWQTEGKTAVINTPPSAQNSEVANNEGNVRSKA